MAERTNVVLLSVDNSKQCDYAVSCKPAFFNASGSSINYNLTHAHSQTHPYSARRCTGVQNNHVQELMIHCTTQSRSGRAITMMGATSCFENHVPLPVSRTTAGVTKRSYRAKELMWTFDVDHVTRNNRTKHANDCT